MTAVVIVVFIYFASFTGYEGDIFEVISKLHVQGSKSSRKFDRLAKNLFKFNFAEFKDFISGINEQPYGVDSFKAAKLMRECILLGSILTNS